MDRNNGAIVINRAPAASRASAASEAKRKDQVEKSGDSQTLLVSRPKALECGTFWGTMAKGPNWGIGVPEHRGTLKGSGLFLRGWESHWVGGRCVQSRGVR